MMSACAKFRHSIFSQHLLYVSFKTDVFFLQAEHRTMAAFVLSVIVNEYPIGQVSDNLF